MKNIKSISIATDGNLKRIAITYDKIDTKTGKVTLSNAKLNRVVTNEDTLGAVAKLEQFAQSVIE